MRRAPFAVAIVLWAAIAAPGIGAARARGVRAEVARAARAYHLAVARRDARAVANLYLPGAWFLASTAAPVHGRAEIERHFRTLFRRGLCAFSLSTRSIHTGGSLVVGFGRYSDAVCAGSRTVARDWGSYVLVYERQRGGGLKIRYDIFTLDRTTRHPVAP